MSRLPSDIDELLTGLLDGRLDAVEQRKIESLLENDSDLRSEFEQLNRLRSLMASLPGPNLRPIGGEVVSKAIEQTVAMGLQRPAWIPAPSRLSGRAYEQTFGRDVLLGDHRRAKLAWERPLLALAAAVLVLVGGYVLLARFNNNDSVISESFQIADAQHSNPSRQLDVDDSSIATNATPLPMGTSPAELSEIHPPKSETVGDQVNSIATNDSRVESMPSAIEKSALGSPRTNSPIDKTNTVRIDSEQEATNIGSSFLLIVDVSSSSEIETNEVLSRILINFDIASARQAEVDGSTLEALKQTRLVDVRKPDDSTRGESVSVDLVFVKSRASRLDAAILNVMSDIEAFPEFALDVAMDPPSMELFRELQHVQEVDLSSTERNSGTVSVASKLAFGDRFKDLSFAARRQPEMPLDVRRATPANGAQRLLAGDDANPIAYALFVIRKPVD